MKRVEAPSRLLYVLEDEKLGEILKRKPVHPRCQKLRKRLRSVEGRPQTVGKEPVDGSKRTSEEALRFPHVDHIFDHPFLLSDARAVAWPLPTLKRLGKESSRLPSDGEMRSAGDPKGMSST